MRGKEKKGCGREGCGRTWPRVCIDVYAAAANGRMGPTAADRRWTADCAQPETRNRARDTAARRPSSALVCLGATAAVSSSSAAAPGSARSAPPWPDDERGSWSGARAHRYRTVRAPQSSGAVPATGRGRSPVVIRTTAAHHDQRPRAPSSLSTVLLPTPAGAPLCRGLTHLVSPREQRLLHFSQLTIFQHYALKYFYYFSFYRTVFVIFFVFVFSTFIIFFFCIKLLQFRLWGRRNNTFDFVYFFRGPLLLSYRQQQHAHARDADEFYWNQSMMSPFDKIGEYHYTNTPRRNYIITIYIFLPL